MTLNNVTFPAVKATKAAIDTGSSLFALPVAEANAINAALGATKGPTGQASIDCSLIDSLPELGLIFGGKQFLLSGSDYILQISSPLGGGKQCISGFMGLDIPAPAG